MAEAGAIGWPGYGDDVHVEVVLVPFFDFIAREELSPAGDAFIRQRGQFASAEPAVMDGFGNHASIES